MNNKKYNSKVADFSETLLWFENKIKIDELVKAIADSERPFARIKCLKTPSSNSENNFNPACQNCLFILAQNSRTTYQGLFEIQNQASQEFECITSKVNLDKIYKEFFKKIHDNSFAGKLLLKGTNLSDLNRKLESFSFGDFFQFMKELRNAASHKLFNSLNTDLSCEEIYNFNSFVITLRTYIILDFSKVIRELGN